MFVYECKPLVLCLTETHVTEEIEDVECEINGYNHSRCNSNSRHTGGVIIYVRKECTYEVVRVLSEEYNYWCLLCHIKINNKTYSLLGVYHSPNSKKHTNFLNYMRQLLTKW